MGKLGGTMAIPNQNLSDEPIRGTVPLPDHSDLRGFSYRAPSNTQGYNDNKKLRVVKPENQAHGDVYRRRGFWTVIADFFRGKKSEERPLNPELVNRVAAESHDSHAAKTVRPVDVLDANEALARAGRRARNEVRDPAAPWPG